MSWLYLQALAGDCSGPSCSAGEPSAPSRSIPTAMPSSSRGKKTAASILSRSGRTCEISTDARGVESWMSSLVASRASPSAPREGDGAPPTNAISGPTPSESFAKYNPGTSSWRMFPSLFDADTSEGFAVIWPKAASVLNMTAYQRRSSVPTSWAKGCGSLPRVPRPVAADAKGSGRIRWERINGGGMNLRDWCRLNMNMVYPPVRWVEYLMGFPEDWTDCAPLEMLKIRHWLDSHGTY